ncbi:temptin-like [Mytilus galloprovincialis]|uniref:Temptin Cys/Cys disulfide domain-containing protein n=2 Tax=Mytilus TaxID=6548 RepID=A0A8B6EH38_MYTGA|nr:Hypothetical predicted protein [Mytilus galloprovincialis]
MIKVCAVLLTIITLVLSRPDFRDKIPSGYRVPNPCRIPATWNPVGHYNPEHFTSIKNPFGLDFRDNDFKWNATLCKKDSDRDGMTNGDELGDPDCKWRPGQQTYNPVGHPGICEPIGDPSCLYQRFKCDCMENCDGLYGDITYPGSIGK